MKTKNSNPNVLLSHMMQPVRTMFIFDILLKPPIFTTNAPYIHLNAIRIQNPIDKSASYSG